jgi:branched-subunit amino acid aminotransferase/4-amino-4-deoxychorismate lyase
MSSVSMSDGPQVWSPRTGRWQTAAAPPTEQAFAAVDSWLVDEGRVRGLDRHRARFATAVAAAGATHGPADVQRFLDSALAVIPRDGRWFPRVELTVPAGELRLWLRPAPAAQEDVVVYATPYADRRRAPRTKGPDLARQAQWRANVEAWDAGEALLAAPAGTVTEGVWSTPVWWDGDVLCALPRGAPVLDSVTRALVLDLARDHGVEVGRDTPSVARLRDCETWMLSALHGIRLVTGWLLMPGHDPEPAPAVPGRVELWRERLATLARPLG